jgi:SPP1 gp7 family putative phage head morphogenesis protein
VSATLFGREIGIGKADRTRGTLQVLPTVLSTLQSQLQGGPVPDPTLGAPFTSHIPGSNWSTVAQMGPGQPATPFPIGGEPRQWVYRVGWNFPTPPDSDRRIDGQLLRILADTYFLLRRCIEVRKAEIISLEWDIVPARWAVKDPRFGETQGDRARTVRRVFAEQERRIRELFMAPEGKLTTYDGGQTWQRYERTEWPDWLNAVLEDYFVGDWVTLWPQRTLGGDLVSLNRVDGEHTKVLIGLDGRVPEPPLPAYQQYLYGVPRASFTADELYFWPRNLRNITPYGFSHVEQMLILIDLCLHYDKWNLSMYNESTLPVGLLETGPGLTRDQIQDIADFLNGAVGPQAGQRMRTYPVPAGTRWQALKPFEFNPEFANYLIDLTLLGMDLNRREVGLEPTQSRMGSKGEAENDTEVQRRRHVPLAHWVESRMNRVIRDWFGRAPLEFRFVEIMHDQLAEKYQQNRVAVLSGQISYDTMVEELGGQGAGLGHLIETHAGVILPDKGLVITPGGVVPLEAQEQPGATPQMKAALPSGGDDDRRRDEEEFLLLWRRWMQGRQDRASSVRAVDLEGARGAWMLTPEDATQLGNLIAETKATAFARALDELPGALFGERQVDMDEAARRIVAESVAHAQGIVDTWNSDVNRRADELEKQGVTQPDAMQEALGEWTKARVEWKGEQIAATEVTEARAMAQADWAADRPAQSVGLMRWVAVMDDRTCGVCRARNGSLVDPQREAPPAHVNCRCNLAMPGAQWG